MNAENLCTTYYLVLLFLCGHLLKDVVYIFTCLCLMLCALFIVVAFCVFATLVSYVEMAMNELPILKRAYWLLTSPSCIIDRSPGLAPPCPPTHFFIF